jgi:serine/threonine protein kinase
MILKPKFLIL